MKTRKAKPARPSVIILISYFCLLTVWTEQLWLWFAVVHRFIICCREFWVGTHSAIAFLLWSCLWCTGLSGNPTCWCSQNSHADLWLKKQQNYQGDYKSYLSGKCVQTKQQLDWSFSFTCLSDANNILHNNHIHVIIISLIYQLGFPWICKVLRIVEGNKQFRGCIYIEES